ncbi:glycine zipper 2TM domain-containing protein [Pseudoduganella sp. LjRoot289]|uniref:glycine zipper 2TM domain-containing protein n=1 Tax=Pseudoduganella sp. LjRoot289 TaxID=3342314 RepID=UPI003ED14F0F
MKTTQTLAAVMIAASALITGCSTSNTQPTNYSSMSNDSTYGVIDSIQIVRLDPATSGVGAVAGGLIGALAGNQVGSGSGRTAATAAGAIGGAVVGNQVERSRNQPYDAYQITVRLDNGEYRTVNQDSVYDLRVGNRVRMVEGRVYRY